MCWDSALCEEILIQYDAAWEGAYQRHASEWERMPMNISDGYFYGLRLQNKQRMEHEMRLRTDEGHANDPYPFNVQMECNYVPRFYREVTKSAITKEPNNTFVEWNPTNDPNLIDTKQIYHPHQLRPCQNTSSLRNDHGTTTTSIRRCDIRCR